MRIRSVLPVIGISLFLIACEKNAENASHWAGTENLSAPKEENGVSLPEEGDQNLTIDRKLIKEGTVTFETSDLKETRRIIYEAVEKYKAYVSSDQEFKSPGRNSTTLVIRVPSGQFDPLLNETTLGIETFDNKDIVVKDVTEEFLDVEARLKTKKELELRYLELLKKAETVTEILEIEKQIGVLRAEIESIEGRLNYLKDRVSFSSLSLTFYETISSETAFGRKFKNGFRNGWDGLVWFFVMLTNLWAFILLAIMIYLFFRIYRKRKKNAKSTI